MGKDTFTFVASHEEITEALQHELESIVNILSSGISGTSFSGNGSKSLALACPNILAATYPLDDLQLLLAKINDFGFTLQLEWATQTVKKMRAVGAAVPQEYANSEIFAQPNLGFRRIVRH